MERVDGPSSRSPERRRPVGRDDRHAIRMKDDPDGRTSNTLASRNIAGQGRFQMMSVDHRRFPRRGTSSGSRAELSVCSSMPHDAMSSERSSGVGAAIPWRRRRGRIVVRDIRLPRTLLAIRSAPRSAPPAPRCKACCATRWPSRFCSAHRRRPRSASFVIAYGLAGATSFAVPIAGILGALVSIGGWSRSPDAARVFRCAAGRTCAGGLAGAATALILNLAPTPYAALEIAFWLLGSLEDRSMDHLWIAAPFFVASWLLLALNVRAFRAYAGEDAAASLGVDVARTRPMVVIGVALASAPRSRSQARSGSSGWLRPIWSGAQSIPIRRAFACRRR